MTCCYPLVADMYMGCSYDCKYCYGKNILYRAKKQIVAKVVPADIEDVRKRFEMALDRGRNGKINRALQHRMPIRIGSLSESLQPVEHKYRNALSFIHILNAYEYPYVLTTKSTLISEGEYLKAVVESGTRAVVQITLPFIDAEISRAVESASVPTPQERFAVLGDLSDSSVYTIARYSPVIVGVNDREEHLERALDEFCRAGVKHVIFEFMRETHFSRGLQMKTFGTVFSDRDETRYEHGYLKYPYEHRKAFYEKALRKGEERGLGISFCAEKEPEINTMVNCCGTDVFPDFDNWNTASTPNIIREAMTNGAVDLKTMMSKYYCPDWKSYQRLWKNRKPSSFLENLEQIGSSDLFGYARENNSKYRKYAVSQH